MKLTLVFFTQVHPLVWKHQFSFENRYKLHFSQSDHRCCVAHDHLYRHHIHCSHHCHPNSHHYMYHYMHYPCQPRRRAMDIVNGIAHIILKLILSNKSNVSSSSTHRRPINSNNNTLAVFHLPCIRKVLRVDSWFHLTTIFSTNIASSIYVHTLHITVYMTRPVTHFPLSTRSDDENYDVRAIFHPQNL